MSPVLADCSFAPVTILQFTLGTSLTTTMWETFVAMRIASPKWVLPPRGSALPHLPGIFPFAAGAFKKRMISNWPSIILFKNAIFCFFHMYYVPYVLELMWDKNVKYYYYQNWMWITSSSLMYVMLRPAAFSERIGERNPLPPDAFSFPTSYMMHHHILLQLLRICKVE